MLSLPSVKFFDVFDKIPFEASPPFQYFQIVRLFLIAVKLG